MESDVLDDDGEYDFSDCRPQELQEQGPQELQECRKKAHRKHRKNGHGKSPVKGNLCNARRYCPPEEDDVQCGARAISMYFRDTPEDDFVDSDDSGERNYKYTGVRV